MAIASRTQKEMGNYRKVIQKRDKIIAQYEGLDHLKKICGFSRNLSETKEVLTSTNMLIILI